MTSRQLRRSLLGSSQQQQQQQHSAPYDGDERIAAPTHIGVNYGFDQITNSRGMRLFVLLLLIAGIALGATALGLFLTDKSTNIKHINTAVLPTNNNINLVVRTDIDSGLAIQDNVLANGAAGASSIALRNTGVLTATAAGTGLSNTGTAQDPVFINTGVLNVTMGTDLENTGTPQVPIIGHTLSRQARDLPSSNAANPVVQYTAAQAGISANTWARLPLVAVAGNAGQGDMGGVAWQVPATGLYAVHVSCDVSLNLDGFNGRTGFNIAVTLRATNDTPASGLQLPGGSLRSDVSYTNGYINYISLAPTEAPTAAPTVAPTEAPTDSPTVAPTEAPTDAPTVAPTEAPTGAPTGAPTEAPTDAPTAAPPTPARRTRGAPPTAAPTVVSAPGIVAHAMSVSAAFQVCVGCAGAAIGDALSVHALLDTNGVSPNVQLAGYTCLVQTSRLL